MRAFDNRGWLTDIEATASGSSTPNVQDLTYTFDTIGNMGSRTDTNRALTENFGYDALNRLVSSNVNSANLKTIAYDALGNITSKSDTGTYTYGGVGQPVHGVTAITGAVTTTFTYDANGNMLTGNNRTITWNAANQPLQITRGGSTVSFAYGPGDARIKQTVGTLTTYYFAAGYLELERDTATAEDRWLNYIHGPSGMVALVAETISSGNNQTDVTRYYHLDHLGSIETITDSAGLIAEANSYDSWGARRFETTWADDFLETLTSETNRGFTSHEHLEEVGLVHMNGRLYDARIGRMISADPNVQAPLNPQNYNRYSYVLNNPLAYVDPSGFFFKAFKKALGFIARPLVTLASKAFGPQVASILNAAIGTVVCGGNPVCLVANAAIGSFSIAVEQGASWGQALKGAAFAAAGASFSAGAFGIDSYAASIVINGVAQGGLAVAQGGKFAGAFFSSVFSAGAGAVVPGGGNAAVEAARRAVIGGTASVIGGGKFANGAKTAAFQYAASYGAGLAHNATRNAIKNSQTPSQNSGIEEQALFFSGNDSGFSMDSVRPSIVGNEFDQDNWKLSDVVAGNGNEVSLIAGHQIALESSSVAFPPTNQFWITVSAFPVDSAGKPISRLTSPGSSPVLSFSSGFTGNPASPNQMVIQSQRFGLERINWRVRIPLQQSAHDNAMHNTVRIFTRR